MSMPDDRLYEPVDRLVHLDSISIQIHIVLVQCAMEYHSFDLHMLNMILVRITFVQLSLINYLSLPSLSVEQAFVNH